MPHDNQLERSQPVRIVDTGSPHDDPRTPGKGIALCLSGGGYRAMLSSTARAARKVDQYAARKLTQAEGGSFYVLLTMKKESACGNVEISRSVRDFQAPGEIGL